MDPALQTASIRFRNRDEKTVAATLRAHGIPWPGVFLGDMGAGMKLPETPSA